MEDSPNCVCDRKQTTIFCHKCHIFLFGRVEMQCPIHKNVSFLMDYGMCYNCKASKTALEEVEMDFDTAKKLNNIILNRLRENI